MSGCIIVLDIYAIMQDLSSNVGLYTCYRCHHWKTIGQKWSFNAFEALNVIFSNCAELVWCTNNRKSCPKKRKMKATLNHHQASRQKTFIPFLSFPNSKRVSHHLLCGFLYQWSYLTEFVPRFGQNPARTEGSSSICNQNCNKRLTWPTGMSFAL